MKSNHISWSFFLMMGMACCFAASSRAQDSTASSDYDLVIGTYAPADSNSIFVYHFNTETGKATFATAQSGVANPSYLTLSPDSRYLYTVSETNGAHPGSVYAFTFDRLSGKTSLLNHQPSGGDDPCYISLDESGRWVLVANYSSGSFSILPIRDDGSVDKALQTIRHSGHGINRQRQEKPHVHCVMLAPNNHDLFVSDLGTDKVMTYELNDENGHLIPGKPPYVTVNPGNGPRHLVFHPNGKFVYLIQEMGGKVTAFAYEPGKLSAIQTVSTTPKDFHGKIWAGDIHISPDGKFLYASNRDDLDDIVIYAINPVSGKLKFLGRQSSLGKTTRNFVISPDGRYLLAGHQNSDYITVFLRDAKTGLLTPTDERIHVPHAVCLKMIAEK